MSIIELEKQIQLLTDQINDIFHATELNFDAIKIHLQIDEENNKNIQKPNTNQSQIKNTLISQCQKQFKNLKSAYKQRSNLRLEYLINEQIKSEEQKVRRQRLLEYEDKIYDHRRLICDKQSFYDSLLKPKIKRPPGFSNEQYQQLRLNQAQKEQRNNFQQLQEETQLLIKLQKTFRTYRISLQEQFNKYQNMIKSEVNTQQNKEESQKQQLLKSEAQNNKQKQQKKQLKAQKVITKQQQLQHVTKILNTNPTLYSNFQSERKNQISPQILQQSKQLLKQCFSLSSNEANLLKQYKEQRQMLKYLKWQQTDLVKKYKALQQQIKDLRSIKKQQIKRKFSK